VSRRSTRIHAAIVHFPIACWSIAAGLELVVPAEFVVHASSIDPTHAIVALIWTGMAFAAPAIVAGGYQYTRLLDKPDLLKLASLHMMAAASSAICFAGVALIIQYDAATSSLLVARKTVTILGLIALFVAGHYGSQLVVNNNYGND